MVMSHSNQIQHEEAIQAVKKRDASYDGRLFFAVLTTGIYCRPSCSSRAAKPENLRFYDTGQEAESAGFRACKRCRPEQIEAGTSASDNAMVEIARYIEAHSDDKLSLATLSERFALSPSHLQKAFKAVFGISPSAFQTGIRQQRFKSMLKEEGASITDALYMAGYGSSSRVYEKAASQLGMTPGEYKSGGEGEQIHYASAKTRFGVLLLAATAKGVCFAMFANSKKALVKQLADEFPQATLKPSSGSEQLDHWFAEIERYLAADAPLPSIPLDLHGTAFQLRVWRFLQSVAEGEAVNYRNVAEGIDQPSAIRAAASACAKNKVALLIPCHRVLRADGGVGGYRWGVDVKRQLLSMESERAGTSQGA